MEKNETAVHRESALTLTANAMRKKPHLPPECAATTHRHTVKRLACLAIGVRLRARTVHRISTHMCRFTNEIEVSISTERIPI